MNRMIYQVSVGKPSKLYEHCIQSVSDYCERYDIKHIILSQPKLRIKPDIFTSGRSEESYMKYGGYLPTYEKENAFEYLDDYAKEDLRTMMIFERLIPTSFYKNADGLILMYD